MREKLVVERKNETSPGSRKRLLVGRVGCVDSETAASNALYQSDAGASSFFTLSPAAQLRIQTKNGDGGGSGKVDCAHEM